MLQEDLQCKGSPWNQEIIKWTSNLVWERLRYDTTSPLLSHHPYLCSYYEAFSRQCKLKALFLIFWVVYERNIDYREDFFWFVPAAILWCIWSERNSRCFDGISTPCHVLKGECLLNVFSWLNQAPVSSCEIFLDCLLQSYRLVFVYGQTPSSSIATFVTFVLHLLDAFLW